MRVYSLAAFLLLTLVFVNGSHPGPGNTRQPQATQIVQKTGWKHEEHNLQDELFGSLKSPALQASMEKEAGEQPRFWSLRRMARTIEDFQGMCDCLGSRSAPPSACSSDIEEFGLIIFNGTCPNGAQWRRRERQFVQDQDDVTLTGVPWCEGTQPLLLVSSGEQRSLRLRNVPLVWMCPGSLGAPLQELVITNVPEVKIAPGVLAHRLTDFTLSLTGMSKELVFPRGALSVDTIEVKNYDDVPNNHMENIMGHRHSPQVKVVLENVHKVQFDTKSVLVPRAWVEVQLANTVKMETQAVEALFDSVLLVSSTKALKINTGAVIVNKFRVTNTSTVMLKEESVMVMSPEGEVCLRNVTDIMGPERAIILGDGATLELSYVSFMSFSNRILSSRSPLASVVLRDVKAISDSTVICLVTHVLSLNKVTASACLRFARRMEVNTTEESSVALCEVSSIEEMAEPGLCADPRCSTCADPELTTLSPIHRRPTIHIPDPIHRPVPNQRPIPTQPPVPMQNSSLTHVNETELSEDAERNWWEEPVYLGLVVAGLLALLVLLSYCIYRLRKRSQKGSYELTQQTDKNGTFSRTIITADNLDHHEPPGQAPHYHHHHALTNSAAKELSVSYHTSHDAALHRPDLLDDHQGKECGRSPHSRDTARRQNQSGTGHQHSSIMTPEDDDSSISSEMII